MKRVYHHCGKWEETPMWQKIPDDQRSEMVAKAKEFTGNAELYGEWMMKALDVWPISCEQNLSHKSTNRQAWIGHAACFLAIESPEDVTREAWWMLTDTQQNEANAKADLAIAEFERRYSEKS